MPVRRRGAARAGGPSEDFAEQIVVSWSDQCWAPRTALPVPTSTAAVLAELELLVAP